MQYMEFYAVRHDTGAVLPNATLQAFLAGGATPVTLYNEAGQPQGGAGLGRRPGQARAGAALRRL